ncbi:putative heparinase superfamily protein [Mycolicibacterium iranicum]|uniref:Putative heparinase superfamily protein n=1 Tax=Mycolicibacterium iranicum TaxID=912594 RepID=A0A839QDH5_MYCIR|nr:putative heparinase superfamily protein [Mycolicibacterium iranicum]
MNDTAAQWATTAANEFRAVARSTQNASTRELANG